MSPSNPVLDDPATEGVSSTRPRSLADELRRRSDASLALLLELRPDLMHPVPADLAALAARATTTASTGRALDALDRWTLQVAEALAANPDTTFADLCTALPRISEDTIEDAVARLDDRALLWRDALTKGKERANASIYLTRTVRDLLGPYPCGLAAPSQGRLKLARYENKPVATELLAAAPAEARELLDRLTWGPPIGRVAAADRVVTEETARTPVEWLLARDLLVADDAETVVLPRAVALQLRDGRLLLQPQPDPPPIDLSATRDVGLVDRAAGQHAFVFVRQVEDLLDAWSVDPPDRLKAGGLGLRATAAAALQIDADVATVTLIIELAATAGLIADDGEVWLPTSNYDVWRTWTTAQRWAHLANVWLLTTRVPALVGTRPDPGTNGALRGAAAKAGSVINCLTSDAGRSIAPTVRAEVLHLLAELPGGGVVDQDSLLARLDWTTPRRTGELRSLLVLATCSEAEALGVTGLGALAATGRVLLGLSAPRSAPRGRLELPLPELSAVAEPLLPQPVTHVLLQADLTAIAPGPLESGRARRLALLADVESTGGAGVYRFSDATIRRGLDAGLSQDEILDFLRVLSSTGVPQPLEYLITDVARRHGGIRVGLATAYIRSDDGSALTAICADKRTAALRPVRLAPTVVAVTAPIEEVLATLRAAGFAPAAESPDGAVIVRRKDSRRAPGVGFSLEAPHGPVPPSGPLVGAAVRALRAGEKAGGIGNGRQSMGSELPQLAVDDARSTPVLKSGLPRSTTAETVAALRVAVHASMAIRIGYADTHGSSTERIVDPLQLVSGVLTAYDHRAAEVRTYAVTRITGVEFIEEQT